MERNIKILEVYLDRNTQLFEDYGENAIIQDKEIQAIENLIKGYRNSEDIMKNAVKENLELKEYIRELEEDNQKFESGKFLTPAQCVRIGKDYIPKSKVKEIVDECIPRGKNIITGEEEYKPNTNANSFLTQRILELMEDK